MRDSFADSLTHYAQLAGVIAQADAEASRPRRVVKLAGMNRAPAATEEIQEMLRGDIGLTGGQAVVR